MEQTQAVKTPLSKIIEHLREEGFKPLTPRRWRRVKNHKVQDAIIKENNGRFYYTLTKGY